MIDPAAFPSDTAQAREDIVDKAVRPEYPQIKGLQNSVVRNLKIRQLLECQERSAEDGVHMCGLQTRAIMWLQSFGLPNRAHTSRRSGAGSMMSCGRSRAQQHARCDEYILFSQCTHFEPVCIPPEQWAGRIIFSYFNIESIIQVTMGMSRKESLKWMIK